MEVFTRHINSLLFKESMTQYGKIELLTTLCLAVIDSPQTDGRWGNTVAGPVFNAVALDAARYLNISPDILPGQADKNAKIKPVEAPSVKYAKELGPAGSVEDSGLR
jgi:hypothetical protein